jgi:hypothetical protein
MHFANAMLVAPSFASNCKQRQTCLVNQLNKQAAVGEARDMISYRILPKAVDSRSGELARLGGSSMKLQAYSHSLSSLFFSIFLDCNCPGDNNWTPKIPELSQK